MASSLSTGLPLLATRSDWGLFIVDLGLEASDGGLVLLRTIRERWTSEPAVLLTASREPALVNQAAGMTVSLLLKPVSRENLLCAYERAYTWWAEAEREARIRQRLAAYGLTRREMEIVALAREGLANAEIAARLGIALATLQTHVRQILVKTSHARLHELVAALHAAS